MRDNVGWIAAERADRERRQKAEEMEARDIMGRLWREAYRNGYKLTNCQLENIKTGRTHRGCRK